MDELKDKYVLDTVYTWGFYADQSPVLMNYVARVNGVDMPPVERPFTYLELGCGNAMTSNILADALPPAALTPATPPIHLAAD